MQNNQQNTAMVFLRGLVIGSLIGILFAPKRGEDTRQELKDRVNRAMSNLNEGSDSLKQGVENIRDNLVSNIENAKDNITDKLETKKEQVTETVEDIEEYSDKNSGKKV